MTNAHLLDMDAILSVPGFFDFLGDLDCDRALDSRDAEPFDAQWMASFDEVDGDPGTAVDQQAVSALTEKAFKLAFGAAGDAVRWHAYPTISNSSRGAGCRAALMAGRHTFFGMLIEAAGFPARRFAGLFSRSAAAWSTRHASRFTRSTAQFRRKPPIVKLCEAIVSICNGSNSPRKSVVLLVRAATLAPPAARRGKACDKPHEGGPQQQRLWGE
ncbi:hypothetical protein [Burkholderia contaminans]|uniref:Uncharacterized protein n=1 Tax=Burkholderia contaminans TaxID=488447 RepID=A0A6P3B4P9_9BURK|nr:hypothetical protein [Burkholderia contaminans]VWD54134.1 hypothetical protein BCO71171_05700 [Burkholderia contaminans]